MRLVAVLGVVIIAVSLSYLLGHDHENDTLVLDRETRVTALPSGAVGPESFAFDHNGIGPYTGVSDGRILRWSSNRSRWENFAVTSSKREGCEGGHDHATREDVCGRPLGLCFNKNTAQLYIADAYMGLNVVSPNGGLSSPIFNGSEFGFINSLDIDQNTGDIYFTQSSTTFQRREYLSIIITGDDTGRLLKLEYKTNKITILLDNLRFPNGVVLSSHADFLLFVETTTCNLYKFRLGESLPGKVKLQLQAKLPGFPDNIKRNANGEFWIGINSKRGKLEEWIISKPWFGRALLRFCHVDVIKIVHFALGRVIGTSGTGVKLDSEGNVVEVRDFGRRWKFVSEVMEENGVLWIGSVNNHFAVRVKN